MPDRTGPAGLQKPFSIDPLCSHQEHSQVGGPHKLRLLVWGIPKPLIPRGKAVKALLQKFLLTPTFHTKKISAFDAGEFSRPDTIEIEPKETKGLPSRGPFLLSTQEKA